MKPILKVFAVISAILYPIIIYVTLSYFDASPRVLSLVLLFVAMVYFIAHTDKAKGEPIKKIQFWGMILAATTLAVITFFTENAGFVKFYPVSINIFLFFSFTITLFKPPSIIFRIAQMQDKSIRDKNEEERKKIEIYCRKVTIVWISFFVINGLIASFTAFFTSHFVWALYNGLISYVLMGGIFLVELIVRKLVKT